MADALAISRAANLSSIVVIPTLGQLVFDGLVSKRWSVDLDAWTYRLTLAGHRAVRSGN